MFLSTRGIVFRQTKYSDTSLVVKILTEEAGLGSYIIKGARGPKSRIKAGFFQPLNLLDLVVGHNEKSELQHIREVRVAYPYQQIPDDFRKSSVLLFIDELLYKSIQEQVVNTDLFNYIFNNLVLLDQTNENPANFHLSFAIHLTRFLGFSPQGEYRNENTVFNLEEGCFLQAEPLPAENFISGPACYWFDRFLQTEPGRFFDLQVPHPFRQLILEKLLRYYHLHLPLTGEFKSHIILHEVLKK